MIPLAFSIPLLVAPTAPAPAYNVSYVDFKPVAFTMKQQLAGGKVAFNPQFVKPVFSVDALN